MNQREYTGNYFNHKERGLVTFEDTTWHEIYENMEKLENFELIPLTEEWLVKLGALKRKDGIYSWHYGDHVNQCTDVFQVDIDEMHGFRYRPTFHSEWLWKTPLQYVHQLQNRYYATTEEELILKS